MTDGHRMSKLAGRTAFVTGAAGGFGLAVARTFAEEGAVVALVDLDADRLRTAVTRLPEGKGVAVPCDVSDRRAVKTAMDGFCAQHGGLHVLVNNAMHLYSAPLVAMPESEIDRMLSVGFKGTLWSLQAATPHLIRSRGCVINFSSVAVSSSIRSLAVYISIKGAIDALTRQQAGELGGHGIRVNAIAPGPVGTPGASSSIDVQRWETHRSRTPLKRLGAREEVAAAALFLVSDEAAPITGFTLKIDV